MLGRTLSLTPTLTPSLTLTLTLTLTLALTPNLNPRYEMEIKPSMMSEEKLDLLWERCDTNANGEISFAEWKNAFSQDGPGTMSEDALKDTHRPVLSREEQMRTDAIRDSSAAIKSRFKLMRDAFK